MMITLSIIGYIIVGFIAASVALALETEDKVKTFERQQKKLLDSGARCPADGCYDRKSECTNPRHQRKAPNIQSTFQEEAWVLLIGLFWPLVITLAFGYGLVRFGLAKIFFGSAKAVRWILRESRNPKGNVKEVEA